MATWRLPHKESYLTQVQSADPVNGAATSASEAMALIGKTYTAQAVHSNLFGPPWIIKDLLDVMETGRILTYSHGRPEERSTIESLSISLLRKILEQRQTTVLTSA